MIFALFLAGLINMVFGVAVFRRARDIIDRIIFMILELSTTFWAWGIALFIISSSSIDRSQLYVDVYYMAAIAIGCGMLAFALRVVDRSIRFRLLACYAPFVVLTAILLVSPTVLVEVVSITGTLTSRVVINLIPYILYGATFLLMFGSTLAVLYSNAMRQNGVERSRHLLITHGILVASLFGLFFNLILPGMGNYDLIGVGPLFSVLFSVSVAYSIVKYSMFDLRHTFMVSLSYVFSLVLIASLYGISIWLIGLVIADWTTDPSLSGVVHAVTALIAAVAFQPIKNLFNVITDKIFFRNAYHTSTVLEELGDVIAASNSFKSLVEKSFKIIEKFIKPSSIYYVLTHTERGSKYSTRQSPDLPVGNDEIIKYVNSHHETVIRIDEVMAVKPTPLIEALHTAGISILVRLDTAHTAVGCIVLTDKLSGEVYSDKDVETIALIADELAVAIENSLRYEQITQFNETLKTEIERATADLRASNKKLKQMDQAKDEFVSLTSHQLRTPLTTIKGYISILLDGDAGELSPQQRKLLEEAFNSSQRMVHLISDFLNVSRIQTGKFEIELSDVNLAEILDEEIEQQRTSATSRQLTLVYDKPEHFPIMQLDEDKIRQVMMNFVDNAIYYSPGGSTINITLSATADVVEFKVVDHGIGVPADEQHKLFTKFARASNAKKQRPDGTGIGLFMAKKVIVALGGSIIFQSKEGKGSTFGFRLNRKPTVSMQSGR